MSFNYTLGIPDGPHNPSNDQPDMKINNDSNASIWQVDHIGFNSTSTPATNSGTHKQVNFIGKFAQGAQFDPASVAFTANGVASTVAEMFYKNATATLMLSGIKAFGSFITLASTGAPTAITLIDGFGIISVSQNILLVTVTFNGTIGSNYTVILPNFNVTRNVGNFTFSTAIAPGATVSFIVLQA